MDAGWWHGRQVCKGDRMITRNVSLASTAINLPVIGYQNLISLTNIRLATGSSDTDFPITNLANAATHLKWKGAVVSGGYVFEIELAGVTIDYIGIAVHNLFTAGATVALTGTADTSSPYTGFATLINTLTVTDNAPLIFQFTPQSIGV